MAGFREGLREWWSQIGASWVGLRPGFEQGEPRIRALDAQARLLELDPVRVRQLVRPRFLLMTSGEYGPVNHLLSHRLRRALFRGEDLPRELHLLATHGDASRKALLDATHAYAEGIAHAFHFDSSDSGGVAEQREMAVQRVVNSAHGGLLAYLTRRGIQSPLLLAWQKARSEADNSRKKRTSGQSSAVEPALVSPEPSASVEPPSTDLARHVAPPTKRDYPAGKKAARKSGSRRPPRARGR